MCADSTGRFRRGRASSSPLIYNVVERPFVPGSPAQIKASYLAGKVG
ncbi:hypothetical protein [Rhodococcus sp. Leaf233]|nr:hypothetical protein [Rhodococcus sp. Leaf233]